MEPSYDGVNFGIKKVDSMGTEFLVPRGKDFKLIHVKEDIDTSDVYYVIEVMRLGKPNNITIPKRSALDRQKVMEYSNQGLDVSSSNNNLITEVFQLKEDEFIDDGNSVDLVYSVPGMKATNINGHDSFIYAGETFPNSSATYVGNLDLSSKGSADIWFEVIKEEMSNHVPLMLTISIGFSPMLLATLKEYVDVDNSIYHLDGLSSTGKTTMIYVAISIYGNPSEKCKNGLCRTWHGTSNAILKKFLQVNGLLFAMDEFSMASGNITTTMYSIASGTDKERLNRAAELKETASGTYSIISTGECGVLSRTNGNLGLAMRVIELVDIPWTKDAKQSERLKNIVKNNYGHAATIFGEKLCDWIVDNGMEALVDRFESWRRYYCDKCTIPDRKERMSGRYAMVLLSADFCNLFFDMNIDIPKLTELINKNEVDANSERNGYNNCYEKITAYIKEHKNHFVKNYCNNGVIYKGKSDEEWGYIEGVDSSIQIDDTFASFKVWITLLHFERIVKTLGYEDAKMIRKYLKSKGYTYCEEDRDTCRKVIDGTRLTYVVLYLPGGLSDEEIILNKSVLPQKIRKKDRETVLNFILREGRTMNKNNLRILKDQMEGMVGEMDKNELELWKLVKIKIEEILAKPSSKIKSLLENDEDE